MASRNGINILWHYVVSINKRYARSDKIVFYFVFESV